MDGEIEGSQAPGPARFSRASASRDQWLRGRSECGGGLRPGPSRGTRMAWIPLGAASRRRRRVSGVSSSTRQESWSGSWWAGVAGMVGSLERGRQSQHQRTSRAHAGFVVQTGARRQAAAGGHCRARCALACSVSGSGPRADV